MLPRLSTNYLRTVANKSVWQSSVKQPLIGRPQNCLIKNLFTSIPKKPFPTTSLWTQKHQISKRIFTTSKQSLTSVPKATVNAVEKKVAQTPLTEVKPNTQRNATDWAIIKQLMKYIWPKNDIGVKTRVVIALSLLVGGKVC